MKLDASCLRRVANGAPEGDIIVDTTQLTASVETTRATANPHVLWRQVLGLVFWAGVFPVFCAGPWVSIVCLLLGGLAFADAWMSGIYKRPGTRSISNNSPMVWGVAMALLLIVAYPTYIINRNKLRTIAGPNVFYWALVVVGGLVLARAIVAAVVYFAIPRPS